MGLSAAASGLAADLAQIDTASNNLTNIATPGYAAEVVNLSPETGVGPLGVGQGVVVSSVGQLTDAVFAAANVAALGVQAGATQTNQVMSSLESVFPEPSTTGIASQLSTLWSALSTLASSVNQPGSQQAAVGAAQSVAASLNASSAQLSQLSSSLQGQIGTGASDGGTLAQANSLLAQVAQLNVGVAAGTASGQDVNALIDQRNAAVNQLASLLGVSTSAGAHGTLAVYADGVQLVSGNVAQVLSTTGSAATASLNVVTGNGVSVQARGQIGATLAAVNVTLPQYQSQLNAVADSLASSLNTLQANGLNADGYPGSAIAGTWSGPVLPPIFVDAGSSTTFTPSTAGAGSAATITVSPALLASPSLIATAAAPSATNTNVIGTPTLDGTNAQAMAALATASGGPDALYRTLIGGLGTEAANASTNEASASALATTAANNLSSISGVNQNNQEVAILAAQNAFQASSKVISAITTVFQSLLAAV